MIIAHINMECTDDRYAEFKKKKFYLGTDFKLLQICILSILNNTLHDLTLIKIFVSCFMGTGSVSVRYSIGHMK
jgi:hypothetical protein